jgi:hypothetical protein
MKTFLKFVAFVLFFYSCGNNTAPKTIIENSPYDGSVWQVENYIKQNLKDPDSYESIAWGNVIKVDYNQIIDVRNPKLNKQCYSDSLYKTEADISPFATTHADLYVVEEKKGWIKFRTFPDANTEGVFYCWTKKMNTTEAPKSEWVDPKTRFIVWNKYRAKNSFGGYVVEEQNFCLDKDGNVISVEEQ